MNRKTLPLLLMLTAGAIAIIIAFFKEYTFLGMLFSVLIVMIVFFLLGVWIKSMLNYFDKQNAIKEQEESEVTKQEQDEAAKSEEEG